MASHLWVLWKAFCPGVSWAVTCKAHVWKELHVSPSEGHTPLHLTLKVPSGEG
jgi:hypothetical protein